MPIRYDEIGNPTKIVTNQYWASSSNWEEYGYELEWEGRQLIGRRFYELYSGCDIWYDEYYDIWFEYNADGIRTSKTVYETEYKYLLNGTQIIGETWTLYGTEYLLLYIYDENGSPMGIKYRTDDYAVGVFDYFFFEKNLQGDIVAIYNAEGEKIGSYIYDAWGNFTVSTVSGNSALENKIVNDYNPFRYRGYYYDKDLGWYYLQTRYYNPQWGRFINADGYVSTGTGLLGYNMFAYCNNNPISFVDCFGNAPSRSVDENGDGVIDYYVYDYTYKKTFWFFGWGETVYNGSVYIYVGVDHSYFDSSTFKKPAGFNLKKDLLVADLTREGNANILAFQAQKINPKFRESILEVLNQYDRDFNTSWDRDVKDLNHEWAWHHMFWRFSKTAQDIDFDNNEAYKSDSYFMQKAWDRAIASVKSVWNNVKSFFGG